MTPALRVPFFDRSRGDAALEPELTAAFQRVIRSGHYIQGPEVLAFEQAAAARLAVPHAIGVSAGTDALVVALHAIGVGPGDEVACPVYTFFATVGAVLRTGATPVLVDVEPEGLTMDPAALAARIGPRTRAIVPVHLFGRAADLDAITRVAGSIPIVEDAAQAFGASHRGRPLGSIGAVGCFSLFPTKNLGGFGDGGLVVTHDGAIADRARALRGHGMIEKHVATLAGGGNYRLDAMNAALLGVTLPHLDRQLARRRAIAERYHGALRGLASLGLPSFPEGASVNQYVVRVRGEGARDRQRSFLAERGVGTEIYYPRPLHLQPTLASLGHREGDFPVAEAASRETLALPIFPELREDEIDHVITSLAASFERGR